MVEVGGQLGQQMWRQVDGAAAGVGLRRTEEGAGVGLDELLDHGERPVEEVDPSAGETDELAPPEAGPRRQDEGHRAGPRVHQHAAAPVGLHLGEGCRDEGTGVEGSPGGCRDPSVRR